MLLSWVNDTVHNTKGYAGINLCMGLHCQVTWLKLAHMIQVT